MARLKLFSFLLLLGTLHCVIEVFGMISCAIELAGPVISNLLV